MHYNWRAYGPVAIFVDAEIPVKIGSAQMVMDLANNRICEMSAVDNAEPKKRCAYLWRHPDLKRAYNREATSRGFDARLAWDKVRWVNVTPEKLFARIKSLLLRSDRDKPR